MRYPADSIPAHDLHRRRADRRALFSGHAQEWGGKAIAVYNSDDPQRAGFRKCYELSTHADRVKHIAPFDFRQNTDLRLLLEQMVEEIANRIIEQRRAAVETGTMRAPTHYSPR
jgi:hypothetical protein